MQFSREKMSSPRCAAAMIFVICLLCSGCEKEQGYGPSDESQTKRLRDLREQIADLECYPQDSILMASEMLKMESYPPGLLATFNNALERQIQLYTELKRRGASCQDLQAMGSSDSAG